MHMEGVGPIGWIHALACIVALIAGTANLFAARGTPQHRFRGQAYVLSMILANGLALFIFHFDFTFTRPIHPGPGVFGFFHYLALFGLATTLLGWLMGKLQRFALAAYLHPVFMILSYYDLLGGLINELFARLDLLRPLATHMVHGQRQFGSAPVGMVQTGAVAFTLLMILISFVQVWNSRNRH